MIQIVSKKDGFRRAGIAHPSTPKNYPDDFFSEAQLAEIKAEPMLVISRLPDLPEPDETEIAQAREHLAGLNVDQLKKQCDKLDIKYPAKARRDDLVELIITNTAPAQEGNA